MSTERCTESDNLIEVTDDSDEARNGWYYYASSEDEDTPNWHGPFNTCHDAQAAMIAFPQGLPGKDA